MEVILLERIERLGQMGDVVVVKDGFARNFLLPKNKALRANKINLEYFEKEKINLEAKNLKLKSEAEAISDKITKDNYIVIRQASDTGQLYGSVNSGDIKDKLEEEGFSLEKNQIVLDKPIKEIGYHEIRLKLHPEVTSSIDIYISRSIEEAEALISGQNIEPEKSKEEESIDLEEIFEEGALPNDSISDEVEAADNEDSKPNDSNNHNEEVVLEEEIEQQESKETDS
ncbi:50S ribosomal protein L9 [Hyphomicrobiales bacterium]|jgi:large subunit ribosomal protein L9|nr:50S ribosomal protein L9 [Hyphomicrobiales bacterium]MDG1152001.1 50S ribosomal protein L9 [Hyphomicrobiales bacterium]MDG1664462.1 50S ribosomal protein L9 [Hyphomicrobiales bacterium]|tara:strand:- start:18 stop:701 length:684 start_codon:yes stop_codon:yes gene_type:complete